MKAEEIMIGDWVLKDMNYLEEDPMYTRLDYQPYQIENGEDIDLACESNCLGDADVYQPIPLTDEILEVNGFGLNQAREEAPRYVWFGESNRNDTIVSVTFYDPPVHGVKALTKIDTDCSHGCGVNNVHNCDIEYVHELQHALHLCGIEKEIVVR